MGGGGGEGSFCVSVLELPLERVLEPLIYTPISEIGGGWACEQTMYGRPYLISKDTEDITLVVNVIYS